MTRIAYGGFEDSKSDGRGTLASKELFEALEPNNKDRNFQLLSLLGKEPYAEITFQGLKRKLGWHQEILSRKLKRLEKDGILSKTPSGAYKLNSKKNHSHTSQYARLQEDVVRVTQLCPPQDLDPGILASKLKNTWFGSWRWYSYNDEGSEKVLTWLSEDGSVWVKLRIVDSVILIEGGSVRSAGRDRCIRSGYELLSHVIRLYKLSLAESNLAS